MRSLCAMSLLLAACTSTQATVRLSAAEYTRGSHRSSRAFDIVLAAGKSRNCDAEHNACFEDCWNSPPPYGHIPPQKAQHYQHCTSLCLKKYMECCKQRRLSPQAFPEMKTALDWLKAHKTEVVVGSVVIVAGVAFIVATGGAGGLVLLPLAAI